MDAKSGDIAGTTAAALYLPALDGLRFFAFLLVFMHHLPRTPDGGILTFVHERGYVGVDLFFAISAYLFFHLMKAECESAGAVDVVKFYGRRLLRLYPLMVAFPAVMLAIYGANRPVEIGRLIGLATFSDNGLAWVGGYNPIPFCAHLWTLSFEFQLYAVIPFVFLASRRLGRTQALWSLAALAAFCAIMRYGFVLSGVHHPVIWVTPFLRPETTLIGMALALGLANRLDWKVMAVFGIYGAGIFCLVPNVQLQGLNLMLLYPAVALMWGAVLWSALNLSFLSRLLSTRPLAWLGKISFGLYVYHLLAIGLAQTYLPAIVGAGYGQRFAVTLILCVALAALSYYTFELPFMLMKKRLEVVTSRPI